MDAKNHSFMKSIDLMAAIFLFVGGVNWGLVGLFDFNLVSWLFAETSVITRLIYILVGISAIYDAAMWKAIQKRWECAGAWTKRATA